MHTHDNNETHTSSKLEERVVFFLVTMGVVTLTLGFLTLVDFLPEKPTEDEASPYVESETDVQTKDETVLVSTEALPIKVFFDSLDREVDVLNPESNTVEALDTALLSGVVRHPDSADFVNEGTIFILGHSSYLPTVKNKNFQAFNGIQKLVWGDTIRVQSADMEYVYSVDKVYEAKASNAEVPLQFEAPKLVLATCNSFGTKDDRFIIEASLVIKRPISR
jgi:LPXTG-site transpeptidase (sortase) family protein